MRFLGPTICVLFTGLTLFGCGEATSTTDGGSLDDGGSTLDGGATLDGGSEIVDGSVPLLDADVDGGTDSGPEPCTSPGATETVTCGACGTTDRFCTAERVWAYGPCSGEGECSPGSERSSGACGNCGTQSERCSDSCAWESIGACTGEGECAPGSSTRSSDGCAAGQTRDVTCDDACAYQPTGACAADGCDVPGAIETVACGMCGSTDRFCTASRAWSYGPCTGEGMCAPGTTEPVACGLCGTAMARCTTACAWDTTGASCTGEGVCAPGSASRTDAGCPAGQSRALTCNDSCTYDAGACEVDECVPGAVVSVPCGSMCGSMTRTCSAMRRWVDGACTGGGVCVPGTTGSMACGRCGTQATLCNTACAWTPSGTCGGEGTCAAGATSPCRTTCGSTGTSTCSATCAAGACVPPAEICNGADDDCNGTVDDGCAGCVACAGATAVIGTGGRYDVPLVPNARTGSCGGSGSEGLLTLTLTATSDVFVSTHGALGDTVVYARRCCAGTELGCADDSDGRLTSVLRLTSLAAGTYTIVVDSEAATSGTVPVDVYVSASAAQGDRCGNPRLLAGGATRIMGNSCGLTSDYDTSGGTTCGAAAAGDAQDAVYYFYVPTTRTVTFDGCGEGFSYDGTLYIRSVCNGSTAVDQVSCDDDSCAGGTGTCTSLGFGPRTSVTLAPGLYYLFVDGYVMSGTPTCAQCGPFDISISGL